MKGKQMLNLNVSLRYLIAAAVVVTVCCLAFGSLAMAAYPEDPDTTAPVVSSVVPADGSTVYTNGTTTIVAITANYSDEAGGSGVNAESVMVHLDGSNMLFDCPVQTDTQVKCNASTAAGDLDPGLHPLDIYVWDIAGNFTFHRTYFTVAVDDVIPSYANLAPADGSTIYTSQLTSTSTNDMSALRIDYDLIDPDPSSGVKPMSHINDTHDGTMGAMIPNSSCVKTPSSTFPTHYSCQMNQAKKLTLGVNTLEVLLKDAVGNTNYPGSDPALWDPSRLNYYTIIDDTAPTVSGVTADATTISASYSDPNPTGAASAATLASGINSGTAMVHVDGVMIMMGCTADGTGISCPTPAGLTPGEHTVMVMVDDNEGNPGVGMGTLTIEPPACSSGKPSLGLQSPVPHWASYSDYEAGLLSVDWTVRNNGSDIANNVQITGSGNTNGVTCATGLPAAVGNIDGGGGSGGTTLQYIVPAGVGSWRASLTASAEDECGTTYTYPET
jgi:hypothetical protein